MATKNFRSRVMKYAHQLLKTTGYQWNVCMIKAWELYRLAKKMRHGVVKFVYKKTDNSIRTAFGTLKDMPSAGRRLTKPSYKTMSYFDTDKMDYRCFRIENLITVY